MPERRAKRANGVASAWAGVLCDLAHVNLESVKGNSTGLKFGMTSAALWENQIIDHNDFVGLESRRGHRST